MFSFAEANLRKACCKCATEGYELCHFWFHILSISQPTIVPIMASMASIVLRRVNGSQLRAKVNERFPIHPLRHIMKNMDDIDGVFANLQIDAVDPKWVDYTE